jgi:hypothetical protein
MTKQDRAYYAIFGHEDIHQGLTSPLEFFVGKDMGSKDTNGVRGFRVCAAFVNELVHNTLGADVDKIYEE